MVFCFLCTGGCGHKSVSSVQKPEEKSTRGKTEEEIPDYYHKGGCFLPKADGKKTEDYEDIRMDLSHTDQGYFMIAYSGKAGKLLVRLEGEDGIAYRYYLSGDGKYNALPLTAGDGKYTVTACENIGEDRYAVIFSEEISVKLENPILPFLYSNQYVRFNEKTEAVKLAGKLTKGKTELEAVQEVYNYVIRNISYDNEKAESVQSGYLPDVDETLASGKGICFDYAALMTAMLRSCGIPTRLDIGYATDIYHAWISIYLDEKGWVDHIIQFDGKDWTLMDPTFASGDSDGIEEYITDPSNYDLEYIH
ncbi:MAG: transglutaminase-like domain-containing protein [Eubacterium sp.]|nr:transglutaminase-like domain-containing protein [Eubacterium sp.]